MIYIREQQDQAMSTSIRELMIKTLRAIPNTKLYREFFSFFREVFYYNRDMDPVDFELACDTLHIMNQVLKESIAKVPLAVRGS